MGGDVLRNLIVLAAALAIGGAVITGCGGGGDGAGTAPEEAGDGQTFQGDPITGRDVFLVGADPPCGDCHTLADAGTTGTIGPNLDELQPTFDQVKAAVTNGPGVMPEYGELMSEPVIDNVAAYVVFATQG
jgi:cytochrome c6